MTLFCFENIFLSKLVNKELIKSWRDCIKLKQLYKCLNIYKAALWSVQHYFIVIFFLKSAYQAPFAVASSSEN